MKSIKNFIYLDDYKMYSISSQIFEGMTDYIIKGHNERVEEKDEQKGNFASGRILADIVESQYNHTEKVFLHDYSYTLFERKLIEDSKVCVIDGNNTSNILNLLSEYSFIKVTGRIIFNDTIAVENAISSFNDLGLNTTIVANNVNIQDQENDLMKQVNNIKDRNQKAKATSIIANKIPAAIKTLAKENGMQMDENYLSALRYLLNYGYQQQFEVQLPFENNNSTIIFSSILKREKLKEKEDIITKKYSRLTEREFTIFGIITQTKQGNIDEVYDKLNSDNGASMKSTVNNIINKLSILENVFIGRLPNEYVIDPIAIYQEL